jgi:hypothetical protein
MLSPFKLLLYVDIMYFVSYLVEWNAADARF